ncbi:MAG: amidohydrolase [Gemmatimonadetes bacterium]|nr:amidohydrolase [Gemmatimonadota bacterium]
MPRSLWRCAWLATSLGLSSSARAQAADLVLFNGKVITVDSADRVAEAVAVRGGKILAVGTNAEIRALAGPATQRVDLQGLTVTPGLLDAHSHFSSGALDRMFAVDLAYPAVKDIAELQAAVAAKVRAAAVGGWVTGRGWDEGKLAERRMPSAADLDAVSPRNPVWLTNTTGHYGVANSAALRLAGITEGTKDPAGGSIDRAADGAPTGVLKETAQQLVSRLVPKATAAQRRRAFAALAREFNAEGMTALKDPGISAETWDTYREVAAEGKLPVRVFALWSGGRSMATVKQLIATRAAMTRPYESTGDDHVIAGGVKLFADGSGGSRTAWMHDDWNKDHTGVDTGNRGYPAFDPDTLRAMIRALHEAGFHIGVHAIGDRAIDWVVDSYAEALNADPQPGRRHSIIHANIPTDHAIDVMADLQRRFDAAYPEPSATFMWWIGDTYAGNFGPARLLRLDPFHTFETRGIRWAGGSDFDVTPFASRYGIWASVAREPALGTYGKDVYGRAEAVDVHTALRSFTIWAARQLFLEKKIGSVEVGKYADLAVWDRDPYSVPTAQLKDMQCQMTLFQGKVVFVREGSKVTVGGAAPSSHTRSIH